MPEPPEPEPPELPPCGIYRTTRDIAEVPKNRLVYFHNHGDPGPGIYTPHEWKGNRARFHARGHTLSPADLADLADLADRASALEPLAPEGFYRVLEPFHCCDRECRRFDPETLVQLGYDAGATPILFTPELAEDVVRLPERGVAIDRDRIAKLARLEVVAPPADSPPPSAGDRILH